jgi:asparagine N-glycosylation enzyme membrane subunit Stt3
MERLIAVILEWVFVLIAMWIWFLIRCAMLIVRVCVRYRSKELYISLVVFVVFLLLAVVLYFVKPSYSGVWYIGFFQLTAVCKVIEVKNADLLLQEPETLVTSVLHTNWFQ